MRHLGGSGGQSTAAGHGALSPLFDDELINGLKMQVVRRSSAESLRGSAVRPEDATLLEAVAPVYRRHVWLEHDAANLRFVAAIQPMLARFGDELATRLACSQADTAAGAADSAWCMPFSRVPPLTPRTTRRTS